MDGEEGKVGSDELSVGEVESILCPLERGVDVLDTADPGVNGGRSLFNGSPASNVMNLIDALSEYDTDLLWRTIFVGLALIPCGRNWTDDRENYSVVSGSERTIRPFVPWTW